MRFWAPFLALFALATAQQNAINIPAGQSTLDITAGKPQTITWTNPSSGTVTIKLQQGTSVTPTSGIVLASGISASDETATFTIDPSQVNSFQYTIEIIDDTNPNNYNFSPNFGVQGATGTSTASASSASSTGSSASASASSSMSAAASSSSASASSSSASASSSSSASASSSSASASSASASASASASQTSVPNSNGASAVKVSGGLLAIMAGAIAVF